MEPWLGWAGPVSWSSYVEDLRYPIRIGTVKPSRHTVVIRQGAETDPRSLSKLLGNQDPAAVR
jgi:hypothetical protein